MKKLLGNIAVIMVVILICFLQIAKGNTEKDSIKCLSDILCEMSYVGKYIIYPFLMIACMDYFKDFFRVGVILRYRDLSKLIISLFLKSIIFSAIVSIIMTCTAVFTGLQNVQFESNWQEWSSYMAFLYGHILDKPISASRVIVLYLYVTFIHMMFICAVMIVWEFLTESGIAGFLCCLMLLIYESVKSSEDIFFNVASIEASGLFFGKTGVWELCIYPIGLILSLFILIGIIAKNRDWLRVT